MHMFWRLHSFLNYTVRTLLRMHCTTDVFNFPKSTQTCGLSPLFILQEVLSGAQTGNKMNVILQSHWIDNVSFSHPMPRREALPPSNVTHACSRSRSIVTRTHCLRRTGLRFYKLSRL